MAKKKHKKKAKTKAKKKLSNRQFQTKYPELNAKTKNILNNLGYSSEEMAFAEPADGVKMSAVILKLAEPLIKKYGTDDKYIETIISITSIVWNKLMFPEGEQEKLQDEMIDRLATTDGDAEEIGVILYMIELITERQKKYFPDLNKLIVNYDLNVLDGNITLNVSSTSITKK
ncbi:hypothetical protein ACFL0M_09090 [Thermodesulfobacteriota bacterium]